VPRARTRRGAHFIFRRGPVCDAMQCYASAGARRRGVDFRSLCSNGTPGVLMVAPSTGKAWEVPPWDAPLFDIPCELLLAVARPARAGAIGHDRALRLPDGAVLRFPVALAPLLRDMCEAEAESGSSVVAEIPMPIGDCASLCALRDVALGQLPREVGDGCADLPGRLLELRLLADFLGVPPRLVRWFAEPVEGEGDCFARLARVAPDLAAASYRDRARLLSGRWADALVEVVAGNAWSGPWCQDAARERAAPTFVREPRPPGRRGVTWRPTGVGPCTEACMPPIARVLLRRWPGEVVLAGGAALHLVAESDDPLRRAEPRDWDLFVCGGARPEDVELTALALGALEVCSTRNALTLEVPSAGGEPTCLQVVRRAFSCPGEILLSFDLAPSRVGLLVGAADGRLRALATESWLHSLRCGCVWPDPVGARDTPSSHLLRLLKYSAVKGFDLLLPGAVAAITRPRIVPGAACFMDLLLEAERRAMCWSGESLAGLLPREALREGYLWLAGHVHDVGGARQASLLRRLAAGAMRGLGRMWLAALRWSKPPVLHVAAAEGGAVPWRAEHFERIT
jgi:hypothetical protein